MRWTKPGLTALCVLAATSCGKSEAKKLGEVRSCSAITMDAAGAANCLVLQYRWKKDQALTAARRFQHEQDSTAQSTADSGWQADAARHVKEIKQCAADPSGDVARCLLGFGWAEARAKATDDSLWRANAAKRRQEVRSCTGRKGMQPGACLQLYYKWSPERALALDDSIRRAQLRR
jgi:hypothetical protein